MIKGILFALFFILLAITIGLIVFFSIKVYRNREDAESLDDIIKSIRKEAEDKKYYVRDRDQIEAINTARDNAIAAAKENYKKPKNPAKAGLIGAIASFMAVLGLVICIPGSFHQVEAGTYAVVKELGKIVDVRTPGTYFDFYMTRKYETYDATVQQVKINTAAYSKDGQTMDLEVYLQYQVQLDKLIIKDEHGNIIQTEGIAGKYVTLESLQARIETQTIEKTKAVMSSAEAMVIIQNRQTYSELVSTTVRDAIGPDYYVNVQDVVLTNIDFSDEFEKAVEDKVVAEQEKQAAITRAEAELEVAKLEAQRKIEEAKGNAEAEKIQKKAAAEAATYNITELARTLGYTVNETYTYTTEIKVEKSSGYSSITTTEATSINVKLPESTEVVVTTEGSEEAPITVTTTTTVALTSTRYDIVIPAGDEAAARFKSLVEDYLAYLAYLEVWDGKLPDVVAGDDAISIIVPNN